MLPIKKDPSFPILPPHTYFYTPFAAVIRSKYRGCSFSNCIFKAGPFSDHQRIHLILSNPTPFFFAISKIIMTSSKPALDSEKRPTLPSIRTLNLPFPLLSRPKQTHLKYQNRNNLVRILLPYLFFVDWAYLFNPLRYVRHSITMVVKFRRLLHLRVHRVPFPHRPLLPLVTSIPRLIARIHIRTQNSV